MSTPAERGARELLARLPGMAATGERVALAPLPGGTHARSWLVTNEDGERYVLRLATPGSAALLDVVTEARAMSAAAAAGVAPAVVAFDAERSTLLTAYRGAPPWTRAAAREPANLVRIAALLRTLHAVPVELPAFAAERVARGYLARIAATPAAREMRASTWAAELVACARDYDARYAPTVFCHHDLVAANILDDGELALVDFEYAVRATPLLDVANFVAMNGLANDERCALLAAYRGTEPTGAELAELAVLVRFVRLMAWVWALIGATHTAAPAAYAEYLAALTIDLERD